MSAPQQPTPAGNWQEQPLPAAGGFPPDGSARAWQPGAESPRAGYTGPAPVGGTTAPNRRLAWIIAVAVLMLAGGGFFLTHSGSSQPKGFVVLPVRLLGLSQDTSVPGELLVNRLKKAEMRGNRGELKGVVAGVYGPLFGSFAVSGGGLCGSCLPVSANLVKSGMVAHGYANVRLFPPGPKGGELACGTRSSGGSRVIRCTWVDDRTAGDILYFDGSAMGLADAAAQSITVRSAVEH